MRGDSDQAAVADAARREAQPRRLPGGLPILLGVLAGLALCALAYLALTLGANRPAPDPAPTARVVCADLAAQRYTHLYTLLSPDLQREGTDAQFAASQRELDSLLGPVRACRPRVASQSGGQVGITLTLQRGQATAASAQVIFTQAQEGWRITSYDQNF